jgi:hypothetical protein
MVAGRSKTGGTSGVVNLTGRTIFGKSTLCPPLTGITSTTADLFAASASLALGNGVEDVSVFTTEYHQKAPYLLFPKDHIFVTLSKYRSCFFSSSQSPDIDATTPYSVGGQYYYYFSSSHDVSIPTGTLRITLYGSLVKEGEEYHNTLNSRLDTNQVHEMIGSEPITDEFDVFYSSELTGSYLDPYITGTIYQKDGQARQQIFSRLNVDDAKSRLMNGDTGKGFNDFSLSTFLQPTRDFASNFRNVQLISENERYWDTVPVDIVPIYLRNGGSFAEQGFGSNPTISFDNFGDGSVPADLDWTKSFPLEAKYSFAPRVPVYEKIKFLHPNIGAENFSNLDRSFTILIGGSLGFAFVDVNLAQRRSNGTGAYGSLVSTISKSDLLKGVYGFGTLNGVALSLDSTFTYGSTCYPQWKISGNDGTIGGYNTGVEIRGWKYGMMNAFPVLSKCIFKRNRFGQMRDMLEQRSDGKFFVNSLLESAVLVRFVDSNGSPVLPYETMSSNLSLESTSSLPYFDGLVRNREEPITLARVSQTVVVV